MHSRPGLPRLFAPAFLTVAFAATVPDVGADTKPAAIEDSVVKVFSTARLPDLYRPWTKQAPRESTGTGVIIEGKRILTNAHVVLYASQVQVQANQSGDKISATVEAISPGIDLAVLKLDDESMFDARPALARAQALPDVKDPVLVYGFPTGGTNLSITKGIVSRIEFALYSFPTSGLRIQIDAAINPGNSGGPALSGDKMVGLAFSRLGGGDNIGYIIPCEEIDLFLADIADGHYEGKPAMFDALQTFENPALRLFLKLDKSVEGIIVTQSDSTDPAYPLKPWDVITKVGETPIDNEGHVRLEANLRVRFQYLIQRIAKDGRVPLTVVRGGQPRAVLLPVSPTRPMLMPSLDGAYPSYFVYGPLVFAAATQDFVGSFNNVGWLSSLSASASPLVTRRSDRPAFSDEGLVVVTSPFFPHKLSRGYSPAVARAVKSISGTAVKNLNHLVELLRDAKDDYVVFDFHGRGQETLVFQRREMVAASEEILTDNGVRAQGSADTLALWNAKPAK